MGGTLFCSNFLVCLLVTFLGGGGCVLPVFYYNFDKDCYCEVNNCEQCAENGCKKCDSGYYYNQTAKLCIKEGEEKLINCYEIQNFFDEWLYFFDARQREQAAFQQVNIKLIFVIFFGVYIFYVIKNV